MPKQYRKTLAACCLGYVTQSIVVNLAPLFFIVFRNSYGFSYSYIATLVLVTFTVQIAVDALSVRFMGRLGYRRCAILSQAVSAAGLALLGILPHVIPARAAVLIAVVFYSVGGSLIEVVTSPITDLLPARSSKASMSFLHSFYSWGQVFVILATTLLLLALGEDAWYVIPLIWTVLPLVNTFFFMRVPVIEPEPQSAIKATGRLFGRRFFILTMLLMISAGATEQIMAQWASIFCERGLGVTKVVGDLLGPCLFAAFMGIGRSWYGAKGEKIDLRRALIVCSSLAVVCYLVTVFSFSAAVSLAGCALCGLGVSLLWPGMISLSSATFPDGGPAMFAYLALGGDLGCALGPYLAGIVSDRVSASDFGASVASRFAAGIDEVSLKAGILAGIIFPIIMLIGAVTLKKKKPRKSVSY